MSIADHRARRRGVPGGVSCQLPENLFTTLGMVIYDGDDWPYLLSSSHALAAYSQSKVGDPILQPGPGDGGLDPGDIIADITTFSPVTTVAAHQADFTLGKFRDRTISDPQIIGLGVPSGFWRDDIRVGEQIWKAGRTTGVTTALIARTDLSITNTSSGYPVPVTFANLLGFRVEGVDPTPPVELGDSGSIWFDKDMNAVGMQTAGGIYGDASQTWVYNLLVPYLPHKVWLDATGLGFNIVARPSLIRAGASRSLEHRRRRR